jgi:hypothetical protein
MDPDRPTAAARIGSATGRIARAFRALRPEQRPAALAAIGLFVSLFLPWYQETVVVAGGAHPQTATPSLTGWGAFSFVEAAVLLVAVGVLVLLFQRAEGRAFHLPGGDGGVITAAGVWTCLLVIWRIFDKQGASVRGSLVTASGIEWGIFVALGVAAFLAWSGLRIRAAHRPEPPLPGEAGQAGDSVVPGVPGGPGASRSSGSSGSSGSSPAPANGPASASDQLTIPLPVENPAPRAR